MELAIQLAERNLLPSALVRMGIRGLLRARLRDEAARHRDREAALSEWVRVMDSSPIALVPDAANSQHYEVPAAFYEKVLGRRLKYSSAYFPEGVTDLDTAEEAMLELTAGRARLADGQRVLELGCGWGSLTLWAAERFPHSEIVGVSNSRSQRLHIEARARERGLSNVRILTADMNTFEAPGRFDRVVSVEMFEHMRNWSALLRHVRSWIHDDGLFFQHVFAHERYAYPFETSADDDWMGRHFFTGGMMPSVDLLDRLRVPFATVERSVVPGHHYARTSEAWLANLDRNRDELLRVLGGVPGAGDPAVALGRWRIFLLACAELFAYGGGRHWVVCHTTMAPTGRSDA